MRTKTRIGQRLVVILFICTSTTLFASDVSEWFNRTSEDIKGSAFSDNIEYCLVDYIGPQRHPFPIYCIRSGNSTISIPRESKRMRFVFDHQSKRPFVDVVVSADIFCTFINEISKQRTASNALWNATVVKTDKTFTEIWFANADSLNRLLEICNIENYGTGCLLIEQAIINGIVHLDDKVGLENATRLAGSYPDFCVVLVDSLRPDHLGCYGYERDTSPTVDAFAANAVRFDQAIASGSWTQPSIMSMMASVPADIHQRVHWGHPHSTNVVTLAETLRAAGYQTVGLVANPMTNRKYGFARGFDFYDDYSLTGAPDATTGDIARQTAQGAKLTRLARDWIEKRRDPEKPLFLFVLYIDVHWDYLPPPPFNRMFAPDPVPPPRDIWNLGRASVPEAARRRSVAAYDGEIRYTDGCISNLLAAIDTSPRGKDTVVVFCSDHGESFWERGLASHGNALFDEELRVPLVIRPARGDGEPAPPRVVSEQVGLIDLAPTLADLAGVPAPTNWVGRSLAPALRGETLPEVPIVLDNRIGDDGAILRGVRTSRWKVLAGPPHDRPIELYDLRADPAETNNLLRSGDFSLPPEVETVVPLLKPTK